MRFYEHDAWVKSRRSGDNAECVEICAKGDHVGVRDSKQGPAERVTLVFTADDFGAFRTAVRAGAFDL